MTDTILYPQLETPPGLCREVRAIWGAIKRHDFAFRQIAGRGLNAISIEETRVVVWTLIRDLEDHGAIEVGRWSPDIQADVDSRAITISMLYDGKLPPLHHNPFGCTH